MSVLHSGCYWCTVIPRFTGPRFTVSLDITCLCVPSISCFTIEHVLTLPRFTVPPIYHAFLLSPKKHGTSGDDSTTFRRVEVRQLASWALSIIVQWLYNAWRMCHKCTGYLYFYRKRRNKYGTTYYEIWKELGILQQRVGNPTCVDGMKGFQHFGVGCPTWRIYFCFCIFITATMFDVR